MSFAAMPRSAFAGLLEVARVPLRVAREGAGDQRVGELVTRVERESRVLGVDHSEAGDDRVEHAVGEDRVLRGALGGAKVEHVAEADGREAGLGAERLDVEAEDAHHRVGPGRVVAVADLGEHQTGDALLVARREALQHGDAVREVAVDGSDRGTGAVGDHRGRQTLVSDLVDDLGRGVEQGGESCRAAGLYRFVPDQSRKANGGRGCFGHVLLLDEWSTTV